MTPLHNAIKYRHSDVVKVLLEAGAELTNNELHLAILDGSKSKGQAPFDVRTRKWEGESTAGGTRSVIEVLFIFFRKFLLQIFPFLAAQQQ